MSKRVLRKNPVELLVVNPGKPKSKKSPSAQLRARARVTAAVRAKAPKKKNPSAHAVGSAARRGVSRVASAARNFRAGWKAESARKPSTPVRNPMTAAKKKPAHKKTKRSPAQIAATKRMIAAKRKASKSKAAPKRKHAKKAARKVSRKPRAVKRTRVHVAAKKTPARRRRAKRNPARKIHRRKAHKRNPARKVHRRKAHKRNPLGANPLGASTLRKMTKRFKQAKAHVKRSRKGSASRAVALVQSRRAGLALRLAKGSAPARQLRKAISPLQRAMSIKSNPGLEGLKTAAMVLLPQAGVGAVSLVGLALAGSKLASMITHDAAGALHPSYVDKDGKPTVLAAYAPAAVTAGLSVVGYIVADKVAPKFKGAVVIGGLLAAAVQALAAAASYATDDKSVLKQAKRALGLGEYTTVGEYTTTGEYTTVGGGAGIFRDMGEYTTVGANGADNATEFAADSLRGLDDSTQFAPGEGGVLSGGIFR